jgi:hypothetical protein
LLATTNFAINLDVRRSNAFAAAATSLLLLLIDIWTYLASIPVGSTCICAAAVAQPTIAD